MRASVLATLAFAAGVAVGAVLAPSSSAVVPREPPATVSRYELTVGEGLEAWVFDTQTGESRLWGLTEAGDPYRVVLPFKGAGWAEKPPFDYGARRPLLTEVYNRLYSDPDFNPEGRPDTVGGILRR